MDPLTIASLGFGSATAIPQWLTGRRQEKRADEMASGLDRPDFVIPESQTKSLALAENLAEMDRLPGQSATEGRLDQTTANTIAMIERMGVGGPTSINAASTAYGNQLAKETELGTKAAEFKIANQRNLQNELGDQAMWENKAFEWNEAQPYLNKVSAIEALREGGIRNKNAAWKNIFGIGANFLGGMAGDNGGGWWNQPIGGGNAVSTPNMGVNPTSTGANINTPTEPEQKRVYEMMWGL